MDAIPAAAATATVNESYEYLIEMIDAQIVSISQEINTPDIDNRRVNILTDIRESMIRNRNIIMSSLTNQVMV